MQVGEAKLVLEIGRAALQRRDSKPYIHDILLSMALSEVRCKIEWMIYLLKPSLFFCGNLTNDLFFSSLSVVLNRQDWIREKESV
jgi:hypothetical protein